MDSVGGGGGPIASRTAPNRPPFGPRSIPDQRPIDPDRVPIDPQSTPIDLQSIPDRPLIDTRSTQDRPAALSIPVRLSMWTRDYIRCSGRWIAQVNVAGSLICRSKNTTAIRCTKCQPHF